MSRADIQNQIRSILDEACDELSEHDFEILLRRIKEMIKEY